MSNHLRAVILFLVVAAFSVLIFGGARINEYKPPIPDQVATERGERLFTGADIAAGQRLYLSRGG